MHKNLKPDARVITDAERIARVIGGVGMDGVYTTIMVVHVSACASEVQTRHQVRWLKAATQDHEENARFLGHVRKENE